jgi:hypothetical protein
MFLILFFIPAENTFCCGQGSLRVDFHHHCATACCGDAPESCYDVPLVLKLVSTFHLPVYHPFDRDNLKGNLKYSLVELSILSYQYIITSNTMKVHHKIIQYITDTLT